VHHVEFLGEPSAETLLRSPELTAENKRNEILDNLRSTESIHDPTHPSLAHDRAVISSVRSILSNGRGVTLIQGDRESWVTFVVTALGQAAGAPPEPESKLESDFLGSSCA
jgi:hypothetical protein